MRFGRVILVRLFAVVNRGFARGFGNVVEQRCVVGIKRPEEVTEIPLLEQFPEFAETLVRQMIAHLTQTVQKRVVRPSVSRLCSVVRHSNV